jgi:hypothetical protein
MFHTYHILRKKEEKITAYETLDNLLKNDSYSNMMRLF